MMKLKTILTAVTVLISLTSFAQAHGGRRLSVIVIDNQLAAQGYLSGIPDDGGGLERPYLNAIHGHFSPNSDGTYFASLPGFDLFDETATLLDGADLQLELLSAQKWVNPTGSVPTLVDATETIDINLNDITINSGELGSFTLASDIGKAIPDIDPLYTIATNPADTLYALEWRLSTDKVGIADSQSVYTILSPPGANATERLHHQSLALESSLGVTAVPEPSSLLLLTIAGSLGLIRRRKR